MLDTSAVLLNTAVKTVQVIYEGVIFVSLAQARQDHHTAVVKVAMRSLRKIWGRMHG